MQEIKCPNCGEIFVVDESGYAQIVQQVRDKEFNKELKQREKDFEKMHDEIFTHFKETKSENAITYTEFEDAIRQVMDYYVGFNRTEKGMLQALKSMQTIEEYIPRLEAATLRELMRIRESLELFKLVRIYIQACLQRKESGRAMYNRTDYPNLDPAYNKCLITSLDESGIPHFDWTK